MQNCWASSLAFSLDGKIGEYNLYKKVEIKINLSKNYHEALSHFQRGEDLIK